MLTSFCAEYYCHTYHRAHSVQDRSLWLYPTNASALLKAVYAPVLGDHWVSKVSSLNTMGSFFSDAQSFPSGVYILPGSFFSLVDLSFHERESNAHSYWTNVLGIEGKLFSDDTWCFPFDVPSVNDGTCSEDSCYEEKKGEAKEMSTFNV